MIIPGVHFGCDAPSPYFELFFSLANLLISFDWDTLIGAFSVVILNLSLPGSSFDYDTSWNSFDCDVRWKYFCLWNFLAVLWIVNSRFKKHLYKSDDLLRCRVW